MIYIVILAPTLPLRAGLRSLLNTVEGFEVLAEAATWDRSTEIPAETDVIVAADSSLDFSILEDLLAELPDPPAILLLADQAEESARLVNLPLRAWGLLPADTGEDELLGTIDVLDMGIAAGDMNLIKQVFGNQLKAKHNSDDLVEELSDREMDVLELLAEGLANKQIAYELNISEHTVKFHVSSIYTKLGVTNRTEAVMMAARYGLIFL